MELNSQKIHDEWNSGNKIGPTEVLSENILSNFLFLIMWLLIL